MNKKNSTSVEEVLDNEAKVKLLRALLKYPTDKSFRGRQLSDLADVPKSTANRKLNELHEEGVLNREEIEGGTTHQYSINEDFTYIDSLKDMFEEERQMQKTMEPDTETLDLDSLRNWLWEAADILRGSIDSADYKNYIFGLMFLKRLSDRFHEEAEEIMDERGIPEEVAYEDPDFHDFYIPERARWSHIQEQTRDIGATINKAFELIEDENETIENRVLSSIDFNDKDRLPDPVLEELVVHFSKKRLRNEDLEDPDVFGRAYEYLIRQFADDAGKKGGEFYTPREVVKVIVECLDPEPGMRVYDPCCGSGGMLVYSAKHIEDNGGDMDEISLYGQEKNLNTWAICEMNMLLHNLPDARIERGDTMRDPGFIEDGGLMVFDRVIANPMWNQKRWSKEYLQDNEPYGRFSFGYPPKNKGDWAWIQHMLASVNKTGKVGVVLDNGVLFRSRSEGKIRRKVLEKDWIEAVIALPDNLFYNTSSPGCILIMNKDKPAEREGKVLFIYGEDQYTRETDVQMFEELSNQNELTDAGIDKIVETYESGIEEEHFSRLVDLDEIEENDWNLNVPRYVDTTEPEEPIDVTEKRRELQEVEEQRDKKSKKLNKFLDDLNYG